MSDTTIANIAAHPLRVKLPTPQRTGQGDYAVIEIVIVEIETRGGLVGFGECLARRGAAAKLDLESFRSYLARQIEEIRAKTGAEQVQFRLTEEQGKVKLKARPVGPGGEGGGSA